MKHPNLHPVETRDAVLPDCFDSLHAWIEDLPGKFANQSIPPPKATLLCGLPGVGKAAAVKAIAVSLDRPVFMLDGSIPLNHLSRVTAGVGMQPEG